MSRRQKRLKPEHRTWKYGAQIAIGIVLVFVTIIRMRLANVPLERDEGEYAYAGQLILQGIPPYRLAYNMKLPGTYYAYSVIMAAFGQTAWGIHIGLLIVNATTILVVFLLGRKLIGSFAGAVGATTFAILSLDRWILGIFAHATHFVLLPALVGLLVLQYGRDTRRATSLVVGGVCLGAAVLMKQQAIFFLLLGVGLELWNERRETSRSLKSIALRSGYLLAGAAIPFAILGLVLGAQGVLAQSWFWTVQYARAYVSEVPLSAAGPAFAIGWRTITEATLSIWLLAALGFALLWLRRWGTDARIFLTALLAASFAAICPGFFFREHYFILLLPVVGLLAGVAVASIAGLLAGFVSHNTARLISVMLFLAIVGGYISGERDYLFSMSMRDVSRIRYGENPFVEAPLIAQYIRDHTTADDRIAVLGSEPEIYFYARRKSATGYIYAYPLMESQRYASWMQDETIREIGAANPKYLVFAAVDVSWLRRPESDGRIFAWTAQFTKTCYDMVGIADIYSPQETTMLWDDDVRTFVPHSQNLIYTFRRKTDAPCALK